MTSPYKSYTAKHEEILRLGAKNKNYEIIFISHHRDEKSFDFSFCGVAPPRIARGPAAYETAEVLLLQGAISHR